MEEIKYSGVVRVLNKTFYEFRIKISGEEFKVILRYSQLRQAHSDFKKQNKGKVLPDFPGRQIFGSENQIFIDQRATLLSAYFTTILKHKQLFHYNMKPLEDFFLKNKQDTAPTQSNTNNLELLPSNLPLKRSISKDAREDNNSQESIYNQFQKQIISIENNLVHHLYDRPNKKFVNTEEITAQKQLKPIAIEDDQLLKACIDFCNNIDEMYTGEEENEQNYYNEDIIYVLKTGNQLIDLL